MKSDILSPESGFVYNQEALVGDSQDESSSSGDDSNDELEEFLLNNKKSSQPAPLRKRQQKQIKKVSMKCFLCEH